MKYQKRNFLSERTFVDFQVQLDEWNATTAADSSAFPIPMDPSIAVLLHPSHEHRIWRSVRSANVLPLWVIRFSST
ncbi:MAG: hypothetical protein KF722_07410 [Nitrospira sp.]|nr:hypothetical protein [Nitrospira sp.]